MSRAVVFTFDTEGEAGQARAALRQLEKRGALGLDDALVVVKDDLGQMQRSRDKSYAVLIGALIGAAVGVLFMFMFPFVGVIFGAGAGALLGKLLTDHKVDREFVADAEAGLSPCTSALLILIRKGDIAEIGAALRPFPLHIYQTSLSPEHLAGLARATQIAVSVEPQDVAHRVEATSEAEAVVR